MVFSPLEKKGRTQRRSTPLRGVKSSTPPNTPEGWDHTTVSKGQLPSAVCSHAKGLFGDDFTDIRVHPMSTVPISGNAPAAAIGSNIYLRGNGLSMTSTKDRHVLGHELAHVLQQRNTMKLGNRNRSEVSTYPQLESEAHRAADKFIGNRPISRIVGSPPKASNPQPQFYLSPEHLQIGDAATGTEKFTLCENPHYELTYGEVVALVGDYFSSFDEMVRLAQTQHGRDMLDFVLDVKIHERKSRAEYINMGKKQAVEDAETAYKALMANNQTHFLNTMEDDFLKDNEDKDREIPNTGPQNGAQAYRYNHLLALFAAHDAADSSLYPNEQDQDRALSLARGKEAGAGHYLTDAFSAGHIRTPRDDVKKYWEANWRGKPFKELFVDWAAMTVIGKHRGPVKEAMKDQVVAALTNVFADDHLDFGDLVSGVLHDYDNEHGVSVLIDGNMHTLYGDGYLNKVGNDGLALAEQAVDAGLAEVEDVYLDGVAGVSRRTAIEGLKTDGLFAAERLMPIPTIPISPFNWRADDTGRVSLASMLRMPAFGDGWKSLSRKIVEEGRLALDTNYVSVFGTGSGDVPVARHPDEDSELYEALQVAIASNFLDELEANPMGSLLDILGPGDSSLVLDASDLPQSDQALGDPNDVSGPELGDEYTQAHVE
jgi:hypothetical protein